MGNACIGKSRFASPDGGDHLPGDTGSLLDAVEGSSIFADVAASDLRQLVEGLVAEIPAGRTEFRLAFARCGGLFAGNLRRSQVGNVPLQGNALYRCVEDLARNYMENDDD